jgi:hypothetical protein
MVLEEDVGVIAFDKVDETDDQSGSSLLDPKSCSTAFPTPPDAQKTDNNAGWRLFSSAVSGLVSRQKRSLACRPTMPPARHLRIPFSAEVSASEATKGRTLPGIGGKSSSDFAPYFDRHPGQVGPPFYRLKSQSQKRVRNRPHTIKKPHDIDSDDCLGSFLFLES